MKAGYRRGLAAELRGGAALGAPVLSTARAGPLDPAVVTYRTHLVTEIDPTLASVQALLLDLKKPTLEADARP